VSDAQGPAPETEPIDLLPVKMDADRVEAVIDYVANLSADLGAEVSIGLNVPDKPKLTITVTPPEIEAMRNDY
jgi:SepF-like predicted cell division protein (DUF552 family)